MTRLYILVKSSKEIKSHKVVKNPSSKIWLLSASYNIWLDHQSKLKQITEEERVWQKQSLLENIHTLQDSKA